MKKVMDMKFVCGSARIFMDLSTDNSDRVLRIIKTPQGQ